MTGKQRLKVLGKYLVSGAVDEEKFNMDSWDSCAINEGRNLPSLRKEGLSSPLGRYEPSYNGETGFEACSRFFHIPYDKALKFFGADGDDGRSRSAMMVGRQLLSYLRRH